MKSVPELLVDPLGGGSAAGSVTVTCYGPHATGPRPFPEGAVCPPGPRIATVALPEPALRQLLDDAGRRFVERARGGPWPDVPARHLDWTPDQIVTHVATIIDYFDAIVLESGSPVESLAALRDTNARGIERHRQDDWHDLLDHIAAGIEAIEQGLDADPERRYRWHGGIPIDGREAVGVLSGELLVHEWDLARTLRQRPRLSRADCLRLIPALQGIFPHVLVADAAAGVDATWRIHVVGLQPFDLTVTDATLTVDAGRSRVDCHLLVRARPFVLNAYQRLGTLRLAATGGAFAYGRRPLLGLRLNRLLEIP